MLAFFKKYLASTPMIFEWKVQFFVIWRFFTKLLVFQFRILYNFSETSRDCSSSNQWLEKQEVEMKDSSLGKLGGNCSILLGVLYVFIGITYLLLPPDQKQTSATDQFLLSFAQDPLMQNIQFWEFALSGLIGIAVVLGISESVRSLDEGWVRWTSNLAILGFAVVTINNFRSFAFQPWLAATYLNGDEVTRTAIEVSGPYNLDPQGWLGFGAVGLWVLVVNLLALRAGSWPRSLNYLGIATALVYWLVVVGFVLGQETIITIAAALGGIVLAPAWYIWAGLKLRQASVKTTVSLAPDPG